MDALLWLLNLPFWQVLAFVLILLTLSYALRLLTARSDHIR